ncbi:hypothetical protein OsI_22035 [Oryza sativa Indica Group]|uniref:Uncharacterized protein n=1 Tax=Oryza sativa subsp. indica TaxID=39946 RepID=B8B3Q1_ORYSI|nr:hypothetical protein OsI_22035 [Oryza sativa Indica Group]
MTTRRRFRPLAPALTTCTTNGRRRLHLAAHAEASSPALCRPAHRRHPLAATAAEPATVVAVELVRLEPAVARGAEEGDEDKAVAVAPANLPVVGEGDAVDVAGPPWVGLDLALDHVAEPDVACTMVRGGGEEGGEEAWKQKGAASIKICPVVVEESLLTISCMHG